MRTPFYFQSLKNLIQKPVGREIALKGMLKQEQHSAQCVRHNWETLRKEYQSLKENLRLLWDMDGWSAIANYS